MISREIAQIQESDIPLILQDNKIHLHSWNGTELNETGTLETRGTVTSLAFSPDQKLLVAGDVS